MCSHMLVSLSVANFRSFASEQTFSMRPKRRLGGEPEDHEFCVPGCGDDVLRTALIYGPSGGGKSNLFAALRYVQTIVLGRKEQTRGTGRQCFRLTHANDKPSTFDVKLVSADKIYRYEVYVDDQRIIKERLVHVTGARQSLIYERYTNGAGKVEINAPGLENENERLRAVVTLGGRHDRSFLATVRSILDPEHWGCTLSGIVDWFSSRLVFIGTGITPHAIYQLLATDAQFRQFASEFLRAAGTGIDHLAVEQSEISRREAQSLVTKDGLAAALAQLGASGTTVLKSSDGLELLIGRDGHVERFFQIDIQAVYKEKLYGDCTSPLSEESDGMQRLLQLMPALYKTQLGGAVYCIDEVHRSMHPLFVSRLFEYFLRKCADMPSQIIATTHESYLLNLLRRDEIWFAEKDSAGATKLTPLTQFNPRKDARIAKSYLQGRFGGVPPVGDLESIAVVSVHSSQSRTQV